ncbi:hypothetical protein NG798_02320 [Ancylothrix sp. C2]|uniref:hypothetical protein n=1 Tax=Ancylothrix sp. D3o TaxID=2953691 RepID=UPI0021BAB1E5|nr:hypothetical protein [Ancylothrix sp. D3o]MCT7948618.1 hypothetical protein [Ancylothrix sp. D3o]
MLYKWVKNFKDCRFVFLGLVVVGLVLFCQVPVVAQVRSVGLFANVTLNLNFKPDPFILRGISGGDIAASGIAGRKESLTGSCVGFVDEAADHVIILKAFFKQLSLQVESEDDTTLVVRGPGGSWCNDDAPTRGKNSGISGEWLAGSYQVWVGSYQEKKYQPYVIRISQK